MGSGLSMASVNKIKELANAREYSLALDIIDSQDLSRSLNPQFLRLCGEVYIYNKRYADARTVLLMAHRLAPEAKRVIFWIVLLYLRMGYRDLAKTYYDIYMFDADESVIETKQLMYIYNKAMGESLDSIEIYIAPTYSHNMDYDWTYETILLYVLQGRKKEAEALAQVYEATYRNTEKTDYVKKVLNSEIDPSDLFCVFSDVEVPDDDPEQEQQREIERALLENDELRIHPKEAEIMIMVDDHEEVEPGAKRKLKKFLKEQERAEKTGAAETDEAASTVETAPSDEKPTEVDVQGNADDDPADENREDTGEDVKEEKKGFLKTLFNKIKKTEQPEIEEPAASVTNDTEPSVADEKEVSGDKNDKEEAVVEDEKSSNEAQELSAQEERLAEEQAYQEARAIFFGEEDKDVMEPAEESDSSETASDDGENVDDVTDDESEHVQEEPDMREIHIKGQNHTNNSIVSVDFDNNDFTAESETVEDLSDDIDYSNPFDSIAVKGDHVEVRPKKHVLFEEASLVEENDEEEYEIDDFSSNDDPEFGEMKIFETEEETKPDTFGKQVEEPVEGSMEEIEELPEESVESSYEDVTGEPEPDQEPESVEEYAEEPIEEVAAESVEEIEEALPEEESVESSYEDVTGEPEPDLESESAEEYAEEPIEEVAEESVEEIEESLPEEESVESSYEDVTGEPEPDLESESVEESAEEPIEEIAEELVEEIEEALAEELTDENVDDFAGEDDNIVTDDIVEETLEEHEEYTVEDVVEEETELDSENPFKFVPKKKKLDYPVFRSSLFPDYHSKPSEIKNNFNEIMNEANDKIQENLLREEQMQREAEALLASLGIDLDSVSVSAETHVGIDETFYDGPSRDELKASLKIDSVKKNILKKLKDYR